jgi:prepilin-type N-terminal cleavage/methylation domain-containing protein
MKKLRLFLQSFSPGFTMIELLVVIAVIGVLAVAVLSSINPIEQINKGRDTRTRSDAAQLINAVDRYYAIHEEYPWNVDRPAPDDYAAADPDPDSQFVFTGVADDWDWIRHLSDTAEVKDGFIIRLINDDNIVAFKDGIANATMYACFLPTSLAFKQEAADNCDDDVTPDGLGGIVTCVNDPAVLQDDNLICLP